MPDPNDFMHAQMMQQGNIPPQAMAAIQQSGMGGDNLTQLLAQLATMSPDEVSAALAQLGINVDPDTLHGMAEKWVDDSADKLASSGSAGDDGEQQPTAAADESDAESPSPAESASAAPTQEQDPDAEMEGMEAQAAASPEDVAAAQQAQGGGMAMANRGNAGGSMDAAISAMMGAGGGARGAMPRGGGMPRPSPMPMPSAAAGEDPRAKDMIANIYRQQMGPGSGAASSRIGIPLGPRTGGGPGETSSPLTRMKKPKKQ